MDSSVLVFPAKTGSKSINLEYPSPLILLASSEALFVAVFVTILLTTGANSTAKRAAGCLSLCAATFLSERLVVQICLEAVRPQWAALFGSLLWVQFLSASDLIIACRVDLTHLSYDKTRKNNTISFEAAVAATGLLWNLRRVGTRWQVKNIPSRAKLHTESRSSFLIRRTLITIACYLFFDFVLSMPPPMPSMVQNEKVALFSPQNLSVDDLIFRLITTIFYWIITSLLNLFMVNLCAIVAVLLGLSRPADCPPLYGSLSDAYTVRRFWGVTWHQTFRGFLTGLTNLIMDNTLVFLPRRSTLYRYTWLAVAFAISGAAHYRADELFGVASSDNRAMRFYFLQAAAIMLEDMVTPVASAILPSHVQRPLGWLWTLTFLTWTTPVWRYPSMRLTMDQGALLPVRFLDTWISR